MLSDVMISHHQLKSALTKRFKNDFIKKSLLST